MGLGVIDEPLQIMFTEKAVIIGIIAVNLPFMVLTLQSVHRGHRPRRRGGGLQPGRRPVAPCSAACCGRWPCPASLAGTILSFILAMNAYATPVLLGGPLFKMMAPLVYNQFPAQTTGRSARAIAFVLMTATLALTASANLLTQRRYRRGPGGQPT